MPTYSFTLTVDRDPTDYTVELYDAGLDDGALEGGPTGDQYVHVDRDAPSLWEAITTAISEVHTTPVRVTHILADELITGADIADLLGCGRQYVTRLAAREDFPAAHLRVGSRVVLYRESEIRAWAFRTGRLTDEPVTPSAGELQLIDGLNAGLAWRDALQGADRRTAKVLKVLAAA